MNKKIKFLLGFLALIAGFLLTRIGLVLNDLNKANTANIYNSANRDNSNQNTKSSSENALTLDSDHDGLPDREEIIYGTNLRIPDTDKDGFLDGEEVITGHNPLNAKDNGKTSSGKNTSGNMSANFTTRISDLAFASIIDDNGQVDPKSATQDKFLGVIDGAKWEMARYFFVSPLKDSDIIISNDNSKQAIENYIKILSPVIEEGVLGANNSIAQALSSSGVISSQNYSGYKRAYDILRDTAVPSSWKELHKKTLTALLSFSVAFEALSGTNIDTDPIKAVAALNQIQSLSLQIPSIFKEVSTLLKSQNINTNDIILNASSTNSN